MTGIQEGMAAAQFLSIVRGIIRIPLSDASGDTKVSAQAFQPSRAVRGMQTFTTVIGPPNRPLLQGDERLAPASLFPHPREPK